MNDQKITDEQKDKINLLLDQKPGEPLRSLEGKYQVVPIEEVEKMIKAAVEKVEKDVAESKQIIKQIETDKITLLTIFGLFASVLSFLTIEFQFLRVITPLSKIVGFTCLLFSLLISFNLALDYIIKNQKTTLMYFFIGLIVIGSFVAGIIFILI